MVTPKARDDPEYIDQLEATLSVMFAALVMAEMLGKDGLFAVKMAIDSSQEIAVAIIERATERPVSPQVRALLAIRNAANN